MENRLELLKGRVKRCVCKYCGQPLEIRKINRSSAEAGQTELVCLGCNRIEFGVEREIYDSASYFVDELGFNNYLELEDTEQLRQLNIAKVCEIISWGVRDLGLLQENGFTVSINRNTRRERRAVIFTERELDAGLEEEL